MDFLAYQDLKAPVDVLGCQASQALLASQVQ